MKTRIVLILTMVSHSAFADTNYRKQTLIIQKIHADTFHGKNNRFETVFFGGADFCRERKSQKLFNQHIHDYVAKYPGSNNKSISIPYTLKTTFITVQNEYHDNYRWVNGRRTGKSGNQLCKEAQRETPYGPAVEMWKMFRDMGKIQQKGHAFVGQNFTKLLEEKQLDESKLQCHISELNSQELVSNQKNLKKYDIDLFKCQISRQGMEEVMASFNHRPAFEKFESRTNWTFHYHRSQYTDSETQKPYEGRGEHEWDVVWVENNQEELAEVKSEKESEYKLSINEIDLSRPILIYNYNRNKRNNYPWSNYLFNGINKIVFKYSVAKYFVNAPKPNESKVAQTQDPAFFLDFNLNSSAVTALLKAVFPRNHYDQVWVDGQIFNFVDSGQEPAVPE